MVSSFMSQPQKDHEQEQVRENNFPLFSHSACHIIKIKSTH